MISQYVRAFPLGFHPEFSFWPLCTPPPLFIPWRDASESRYEVLWIKQVRFRLGHDLRIPLTIRRGLAQKLQSAAGSSWPVESGS